MQFEVESKEEEPTCLQNSNAYFNEFCENTTIHGFQFLGEKRRSIFERLFWLTFMVISVYFCITLIIEACQKWKESPVVVSFATTETPVWKIPFPAITICPQIKSSKSVLNYTNLFLLSRKKQKLTELEANQFKYMSLVCTDNWNLNQNASLEEDYYNGGEIENFLMQMQPDISTVVIECYWLGLNCTPLIGSMFTPILTNEGICFSFNVFDRSELLSDKASYQFYDKFSIPHQPSSKWSIHEGYDESSTFLSFPRRTVLGGAHGGLDLTLEFNSSDMDYLCGESLEGFKFILHNPTQFPSVKQNYFRVGINKDATVAVKPTIVTTSKQLKNYSPQQRECFYENEKELKFFKHYDQQNCLQECLSNFTKIMCNCVTFAMLKDNSTLVCGPAKKECIQNASTEFLAQHINLDPSKRQVVTEDCNCLPSCSALSFETEVTQSEWKWQESAKILAKFEHELPSESAHLSRVQIFYNSMQFITTERNELFGVMEFLSSCGGLLGLFTGFSFLSIIEILYYLSLRIICNFKIFGRRNWAGRDNI